MTPIGSATTGAAWFLNGIAILQRQEEQTQRQISSGFRVQDASDSPSQTPELISAGSSLARFQAYQSSLSAIQTEAQSADQALNTSITLVQNARALALQGANSTSTAADRQNTALQINNIQEQLVSISNTSVSGRYIFGGDQDQAAPYRLNTLNASGVDVLTAQTSGRVIVNPQGQPVFQGLTANQIFNPASGGVPAAANTLVALQSLKTALQANDQPGIASALTSLKSASDFLGQQQAYYGASEQRITSEQNSAANEITSLQVQIGKIRDTDIVQAATDLTQETTRQSAAFGAQAAMPRKSLFDYLG